MTRIALVVAAFVSGMATFAAIDGRLTLGEDWLHEQWVYLFALPMSWLGLAAAWLDDHVGEGSGEGLS